MSQPLVSVIICSYLEENERFVQLALESIRRQTHKNLELVYVSSTRSIVDRSKEMGEIPVKHYHSQARMHYPEAVAKGYEKVSHEAKFILLLNDDCFMADDCLENLLLVAHPQLILNPLSNCDDGYFHLGLNGYMEGNSCTKIDRQPTYESIMPIKEKIMTSPIRYPPHVSFTGFAPFYCTLMPKQTWELVGGIDRAYRTGADDLDFGIRARALGYRTGIALNAYALHFSGKSADVAITNEDREFNAEYFKAKHGYRPNSNQWVE